MVWRNCTPALCIQLLSFPVAVKSLVSLVQILSVRVEEAEVTVSYCHNVASRQQNELRFTLALQSGEVSSDAKRTWRSRACESVPPR